MSASTVLDGLPRAVEEVTAEWLTQALGRTVDSVEVVEAIWGTATKLRIRTRFAEGPPAELCVKGGLDRRWLVKAGNALVTRLRLFDPAGAYRLEASFYEHLAPVLDAPLPRCWFAASDPATGQGIVVLDDLVAAGVTFGDPTMPWPVERVAAALEVQAAWHAATWGSRFDWLPRASIIADLTPLLLSAFHWNTHFRHPRAPPLPEALADRRRVLAALREMWRSHAQAAACVSHGDAHIGNAYVDASAQPVFFDWQAVCPGPALDDVSYFITGALAIADRRAHERDLIAHYLSALGADGAPVPSFDEAWRAYRRYSLHGFLWAVTPPLMQPWENVRAMAERHLTAILDLDGLGANA